MTPSRTQPGPLYTPLTSRPQGPFRFSFVRDTFFLEEPQVRHAIAAGIRLTCLQDLYYRTAAEKDLYSLVEFMLGSDERDHQFKGLVDFTLMLMLIQSDEAVYDVETWVSESQYWLPPVPVSPELLHDAVQVVRYPHDLLSSYPRDLLGCCALHVISGTAMEFTFDSRRTSADALLERALEGFLILHADGDLHRCRECGVLHVPKPKW